MPSARYERLNNYVMGIIYSPLLLLTSFLETRHARRVQLRRRLGETPALNGDNSDGDDNMYAQEWEEMAAHLGVGDEVWEEEGWAGDVEGSRPNVEVEAAVMEVRALKTEVGELKGLVRMLVDAQMGKGTE